jgi:hypothetical protein
MTLTFPWAEPTQKRFWRSKIRHMTGANVSDLLTL